MRACSSSGGCQPWSLHDQLNRYATVVICDHEGLAPAQSMDIMMAPAGTALKGIPNWLGDAFVFCLSCQSTGLRQNCMRHCQNKLVGLEELHRCVQARCMQLRSHGLPQQSCAWLMHIFQDILDAVPLHWFANDRCHAGKAPMGVVISVVSCSNAAASVLAQTSARSQKTCSAQPGQYRQYPTRCTDTNTNKYSLLQLDGQGAEQSKRSATLSSAKISHA